MTQTLFATFDGEVFRPAEPVKLDPDTQVQLVITAINPADETPVSFLRVARSLNLSGPADWSTCLDKYLYGRGTASDE